MFRRRILFILVALLLALAPIAAFAKLNRTTIMVTGNGAAQQVTTNAAIYARTITFHSKVGNAATVYIGGSTVSASVFQASLSAGGSYSVKAEGYYAAQGEQYQVDDFYVFATNPDLVSVTYDGVE